MEEGSTPFRFLMGKTSGRRPVDKPKGRWVNNKNRNNRDSGFEGTGYR